jgi:molybdopterin-guanine dinucleotide biosynthesis protein A
VTIPSAPHPGGATGDDVPAQPCADVGLVVLAGGRSQRWQGIDKTAADLAGRPVVVHAVVGARGALGTGVPAVVVAPPEHPAAAALLADGVLVVREDPPGGGPVAGLAAGVAALGAVDVVAVVAGDVPFGGPALRRVVSALAADEGVDAVVGQDPTGRRQPLLGAYRAAALRAALAAAPAPGRSVRSLLAGLRVATLAVDTREALDLDTPDDLAAAAALVDP